MSDNGDKKAEEAPPPESPAEGEASAEPAAKEAPKGLKALEDLSAEEREVLQQQAYAAEHAQLMEMVWPFVKDHLTPEKLAQLTHEVMHEQFEILQQIWPTLFGDAEAEMPAIRVHFWGPEATGPEDQDHQFVFNAPKQIRGSATLPGAGHGLMLGFLLSPASRLALRAFGYQYRFTQGPGLFWDKDKPKIIMPN